MRRRKFLIATGGTLGATGMVTSTASFSSTQADRDVNVDVVEDDEALLQLEYSDEIEEIDDCGASTHLVTLGNLFTSEITVENFDFDFDFESEDFDFESEDVDIDLSDPTDDEIEEGDSIDVEFHPPKYNGPFTVEFGVEVSGPGVHAETARNREVDFDASCASDSVEFQQNGNWVEFGRLNPKVWTEGHDSVESELVHVERESVHKNDIDGQSIIAISFGEPERLVVHPKWDGNELSNGNDEVTANSGNGVGQREGCDVGTVDDISEYLEDEDNYPVC